MQKRWNIQAIRRVLLVALPLLLLALSAPTLYNWYQSSPYVQSRALAAARERWEARPFDRYILTIEQDSDILTYVSMEEHYAVWDESLYIVQRRVALMSVTQFFALIERYPRHTEFRCGGVSPTCPLPATYRVIVDYDEQWGYPQTIQLSRTDHPDWLNPDFWGWLWQSGAWQQCGNPLCISTEYTTISIAALTPET